MNDRELPRCPKCGSPAQTYQPDGEGGDWSCACSVCSLTLGPFDTRLQAMVVWFAAIEIVIGASKGA